MGILEVGRGAAELGRVAEHMAVGTARASQRLEQARQQAGAARVTVAVRQPQAVVVPRRPIDG